jgi:hypothetical protein
MRWTATQAPPAQTTLRAYPPAPARVELAYLPLPGRLTRTLLSLAVFWGVVPYVVWIPPHYPWPAACLVAGAYLAHRFWTGRYRVRSFLGVCPRCGRHLRIDAGALIDLPHTLTCFGCHFEPRLEVDLSPAPAAVPKEPPLRHFEGDCAGTWSERWYWDDPYVACSGCGARHPATPAARRAADEENLRGALLQRLADEGRFLI